MKINSINNNVNQKQQSFSGIPGQNFSRGLADFVSDFYGSRGNALRAITPKSSLDCSKRIRHIKIESPNSGRIDPVIDLARIEGSDNFRLSASLSGIEGDSAVHLNPKEVPANSNPLEFIAHWAENAAGSFQRNNMQFLGMSRTHTTLESLTDAVVENIYQL